MQQRTTEKKPDDPSAICPNYLGESSPDCGPQPCLRTRSISFWHLRHDGAEAAGPVRRTGPGRAAGPDLQAAPAAAQDGAELGGADPRAAKGADDSAADRARMISPEINRPAGSGVRYRTRRQGHGCERRVRPGAASSRSNDPRCGLGARARLHRRRLEARLRRSAARREGPHHRGLLAAWLRRAGIRVRRVMSDSGNNRVSKSLPPPLGNSACGRGPIRRAPTVKPSALSDLPREWACRRPHQHLAAEGCDAALSAQLQRTPTPRQALPPVSRIASAA